MRFIKILWIPIFTFAITSCTQTCQKKHKDMSPEEVVEAYLNIALNMTSLGQKKLLLEYTTGPLHEAIAQVDDVTIKEAYIDKDYKLKSYSVVERRDRTPRETEITFQLIYKILDNNIKSPDNTPLITTENTVSVVKEKGEWLINRVLNKKSTFDFPLSLGASIKAKPADGSTSLLDDDKNH